MVFYIGDYELNVDTHELLHKGCPQKIEPKVFKLLLFVLENPDRILSRDELINNVWNPCIISDSALNAAICSARHAIGDNGTKQQCIKTVSGCGYRFIATYTRSKGKVSTNGQSAQTETSFQNKEKQVVNSDLPDSFAREELIKPLKLPDKPSVAIMDFSEIGTNEIGCLLACGLSVEINCALSRLPHFFVISRASANSLSKLELRPQEIARRLGVRYLVYGNTQSFSERIQVNISVVDAIHDVEIWSEHFDKSFDDIPQIQNEITCAIVAAIDSVIEQAEIERAFLTPTENLSAWENYHRGLWHINRTTVEDVDIAQQFFQKAIMLDPRFSRAYAGLSYITTSRKTLGALNTIDNYEKACDYAQRSIDCCKYESMGYMALGRTFYFGRKIEEAIETLDIGVRLNQNHFHCHSIKGAAAAQACKETMALRHFKIGERLSPFDPLLFSLKMGRATALAYLGKYDEALVWSRKASNYPNAYFATHATETACLQLAGYSKRAQQSAAKIVVNKPDFSVEMYARLMPHTSESARAFFLDAMVDAGIPKVSPPP